MAKTPLSIHFWRAVLGMNILLTILSTWQYLRMAESLNASGVGARWAAIFLVVILAGVASAIGLIGSWTKRRERLIFLLEFPEHLAGDWSAAGALLIAGSLPVFGIASFTWSIGHVIQGQGWMRMMVVWWLALAAAYGFKLFRKDLTWQVALGAGLLSQGLVFSLALLGSQISNLPFSLAYSEGSRIYDASLILSRQIYGVAVPPPILFPSLHVLLAVPFLLGHPPIWVFRAWQVLLTIGVLSAIGIALIKQVSRPTGAARWLFIIWVFLFLQQAPTYFNVWVTALIVLVGVRPRRFGRSLLTVMLASIWAGLSRINWFPVPGMLAAAIYLLEIPVEERKKGIWGYLLPPVSWFLLGTLTAVASQFAYIFLSGNGGADLYFTSLKSDLLWNRLLPSAEFNYGILPGILLVSGPTLLILIWGMKGRLRAWHPIRLLGLAAALIVLFAGGIVVSVKIGGGSDLHNLDAYLILLLLIGAYLYFGRFVTEAGGGAATIPWGLAGLAMIVPLWMTIQIGQPRIKFDPLQIEQTLALIQKDTLQATQAGQDVLFVSQRQLLPLALIKGIPLVPDYEQDIMVEMIYAHNQKQLDRFHNDLKTHRFGVIVMSPQDLQLEGRDHAFSEENNYWVEEVSTPLLCYYTPEYVSQILPVALYVPRSQSCK